MSEQIADRIKAHIAGLPVPPRPEFETPVGSRNRKGRWLVPVTAAMAVLLVFLFTGGQVRYEPGQGGDGPAPTIPDKFAGYSYLTASLSGSGFGPAIAFYTHGIGVELFDSPQHLVLSAYGDIFRRVPASGVLSPDGTKIIWGGPMPQDGLTILDLTTGEVRLSPTQYTIKPLAWSPDGKTVAGMTRSWRSIDGQLVLIDVATGAERYLDYAEVTMAAFAPDSTELAVQNGRELLVVDMLGNLLRKLALPTNAELLSGTAWSPDGKLITLLTNGPPGTVFTDATDTGQVVPEPFEAGRVEVEAAWTGSSTLLTAKGNTLVEINVNSGETRQLSQFDTGPFENYKLGHMQFATDLLPHLQTREASWLADRGPWLAGLRLAGVILVAAVAFLIVRQVRKWRSRPAKTPSAES